MSSRLMKKWLFIGFLIIETTILFFLIYPQVFDIDLSKDKEDYSLQGRHIVIERALFARQQTILDFSFTNISPSEVLPQFTTLVSDTLVIQPENSDIGNYTIKLTAQDEHTLTTYISITVKIQLSFVDFDVLEKSTETILGEYLPHFAVYLYDSKRKEVFAINGETPMYPASISKIPYALLTLKGIDEGSYSLETTYPISDGYKEYTFDKMYNFEHGTEVSIATYLEYLLQKSDNTAMTHLEQFHGGTKVFNSKLKTQLGITNFTRNPHITTASAVGEVLRNIHDQKYLSQEMNAYLLDLMIHTSPQFHDRIKAGLATFEEAVVAHKIGNLEYDGLWVYSDAGIVYGKDTDFVLVVLSQDLPAYQIGSSKIREITEMVYKNLN